MATMLCAGNTGSVTGTVIDKKTREPLYGANVIIVNEQKGAATDLDGKYTISDVEIGNYSVKISYVGYKTVVKNRVVVKPERPTVVNVELEEDVSTTGAVVVTTSYFEIPKDAPVSARTMEYEEIAAQPGGSYDIQRAIQALPSVVSGSDGSNEIIVRGGNFGENLFVLDNIEIPNPNHFAFQGASGGAISTINLDLVEDVDFYAGAFPARYGNKASSVLDIRLRDGLNDAFHYKLDSGIMGVGGSVEGPLFNQNGSFVASAHKDLVSLVMSFSDLTAVPYYWDTQGKVTYNFSPTTKLSGFYLYAEDGISVDSDDMDEEDVDEKFEFEYDTDQYAVGGTLSKVYKNSYMDLTLSSTQNSWAQEFIDDTDTEAFHNYSTERTHTLKGSYTLFPSDYQEFTIGLGVSRSTFDYDFFLKPDTLYYYGEPTDYVYSADKRMKASTNDLNSFIQYRHNFGALLTTNIGGRVDYMNFTENTFFSPRFSVSYKLTDKTEISAAAGRHYQAPDWYQLAFNGRGTKLKHYYTDQYVIGISHLFTEDVRGSIEVYHKSYRDIPVSQSEITDDPYDMELDYINHMKGYSNGIEFFLQKKVKENFWGTLSYSYSDAKNLDPRKALWSGEGENPYGYFSKSFDYGHVFTGVLGYQAQYKDYEWYQNMKTKRWYKILRYLSILPSDLTEYSIRYRYLGGRPYSKRTYDPGFEEWYVDPGTPYNELRMRAYERLDLRIQSQWYKGRTTISSYIEIDNILSRKNIYGYSYNSDGTVEEIYQLPLIPMAGIIIEF